MHFLFLYLLFIDRRKEQKEWQERNASLQRLHAGELPKKKVDVDGNKVTCPEKCHSLPFVSTIQFSQHYVRIHEYPIVYYDQPILIKFLVSYARTQFFEKRILHRCIIKFMYEANQYFLLEFFDEETHCNISMQDLTSAQKSNYEFTVQSIHNKFKSPKTTCSTLQNKRMLNVNFTDTDANNEYYLWINNKTNTKKYCKEQLISRPGCIMCCGDHDPSNCKSNFVMGNNVKNFKNQEQKVREFSSSEKNFRVNRQNEFLLLKKENCDFIPRVYIKAPRITHRLDNLQKNRIEIISERSIKETELGTILDGKEEKNRLISEQIEEQKRKLQEEESQVNEKKIIIEANNAKISNLGQKINEMR